MNFSKKKKKKLKVNTFSVCRSYLLSLVIRHLIEPLITELHLAAASAAHQGSTHLLMTPLRVGSCYQSQSGGCGWRAPAWVLLQGREQGSRAALTAQKSWGSGHEPTEGLAQRVEAWPLGRWGVLQPC